MAFPASPNDNDTHDVGGVHYTFKAASNRWVRPNLTIATIRPNLTNRPNIDGEIIYDKSISPPIARVDGGSDWWYFGNAKVLASFNYARQNGFSFGTNFQQYRHVRATWECIPRGANRSAWLVFIDSTNTELKNIFHKSIINWGTGGETHQGSRADQFCYMTNQLRQDRIYTVVVDIYRPESTKWNVATCRVFNRRPDNDSGQVWNTIYEIHTTNPLKSARFIGNQGDIFDHYGMVEGWR